ncbi:MAG: M23 family metallopeptidase [Candidatus Saccharimonadales bacterium]
MPNDENQHDQEHEHPHKEHNPGASHQEEVVRKHTAGHPEREPRSAAEQLGAAESSVGGAGQVETKGAAGEQLGKFEASPGLAGGGFYRPVKDESRVKFAKSWITSPFGKNLLKKRLIIGLCGLLISFTGFTAGFFYYFQSTIPKQLITQAEREVKQRFEKYVGVRGGFMLARYLNAHVFKNKVAFNDCKSDKTPVPIVTKDCFYRTKRDNYPDTKLGKLFRAWKDGRLEAKLANAGITIDYLPDTSLDNGKRGPAWIMRAGGSEVHFNAANIDEEVNRFFRGDGDITRAGRAELYAKIMDTFKHETRAGPITNIKMRQFLRDKYGLSTCVFFCDARDRIDSKKNDIKTALQGALIRRVILPSNGRAGLFLGCMFSQKDYSCKESDSRFRDRYGAEIDKLKAQFGDNKVEDLIKLADEFKGRSEKHLTAFMVKKIILKVAERLGPAVASKLANVIPVIGTIIDLAISAYGAVAMGLLLYNIYDFASGPQMQYAATMVKAAGFTGAYQILRLANDERQGAKQVYDLNVDGAYDSVLKGAEKSYVWQSRYGNVEGLANFSTILGKPAIAAEGEYPHVCNGDGDTIPPNQLLCPQWRFDTVPPAKELFANVEAIREKLGDLGKFADEVAAVGNEVVETINAPLDAATEAALETKLGKEVLEFIKNTMQPVTKAIVKWALAPPFESVEDISGAKLYDAAWGGAVWSQNDLVRGGVDVDGEPYGYGGRLLSEKEAADQVAQIRQEEQAKFAQLSLFEKMFSTEYQQSFSSQLATAMPTGGVSPGHFVANILNPLMPLKLAGASSGVNAANGEPNPFHIPQYGFGGEISTPLRDENDAKPCPNDRTPQDAGTAGWTDRGLGRGENPNANICILDEQVAETFAAYYTNEPLDKTAPSLSNISDPSSGGGSTGQFEWPIEASDFAGITSCYGNRSGGFHYGLDMIGKKGAGRTEVHAADGGQVLTAGWSNSAGNWVVLKHGNNLYTIYMHMSQRPSVRSGQTISKGHLLGYEGNTGQSFGAHVHFTIAKDRPINNAPYAQDPLKYLKREGVYKAGISC